MVIYNIHYIKARMLLASKFLMHEKYTYSYVIRDVSLHAPARMQPSM